MYSRNRKAWNGNAYDAWINRFGDPKKVAAKTRKNPIAVLQPILEFFGPVAGKKIMNLMGSNGIKALALAMLGAEVTIVDYSEENAAYARELAGAASLDIRYLVSDVLELPGKELKPQYDIVFAELGIVHYFDELDTIMHIIEGLLIKGGRFILRDFHPVSVKFISSRGSTAKIRKHKITGDYFDTALEEKDASFTKFLPAERNTDEGKVLLRKWTLGEIVTAAASSGLCVKVLREEPNLSSDVYDRGIPKTFTLVAEK